MKDTIYKKFDVYFNKSKNSYWIVFIDNDGEMKAGRMGPFNTHLESLTQLDSMKYMGNYGEDNSLADLWKSNPAVLE